MQEPGFNGHQSCDRQLLLFAANVRMAAEVLLSPMSHLAMHLSQYLRMKEGRDVNGNSIPQPEQQNRLFFQTCKQIMVS